MNILVIIWNLVRSLGPALDKLLAGQLLILRKIEQLYNLIVVDFAREHITFNVKTTDGMLIKGVASMEMTADQKVRLVLEIANPVTGKPALVDGVPVWASSDETVITVVPEADGMSATVFAVVQGSARVVVTADADLGAGVTTISGEMLFDITPGALPTITLVAGVPESQ